MTDIEVKILEENEVADAYVDWFSDPEVVRYSDNSFGEFSLEGQREYVRNALNDKKISLFGVFFKKYNHIGNVALKNINYCHLSAEITFVVGSREQWGKGIASYAVGEVISIAKNEMGLEKIYAGCAHLNEGSKKVLLNNGFSLEGIRRSHLCYGGIRMDQLDYGLLI